MADQEVVAPEEPQEPEKEPEKEVPKPFPYVGANVHYVRDDYSHLEGGLPEGEHVISVVRAVNEDGSVTLFSGGATIAPVAFASGGTSGTWHWPEPEKQGE